MLFGHLIDSGSLDQVALGFYLGAAVMAVGGIAELLFGVKAEQKPLEDIATPLTAQDAETDAGDAEPAPAASTPVSPQRRGERFRPGPGRVASSPGMWASIPAAEVPLDEEIEAIVRALRQQGPIERQTLARLVGARYWGPGRFRRALGAALVNGRVRRVGRGRFDTVQAAPRR